MKSYTSPRIPISAPALLGNEQQYVLDCLIKNQLTWGGNYVTRFEREFAHYCGAKYAVTTNNGTTALHLALASWGLGPGDVVLVPALTYVATASAVLYCGATPVPVDVEPYSWGIDPARARETIQDLRNRNKNVVGIIPVHLYGVPCRLHEILELANQYDLFVIEDAAQAHGALYDNSKVGTHGLAGVFSFYGNKIITTGEGGIVVTNNRILADKARALRGHAMDSKRRFFHNELGYNYRMTNLQAAIGCAQLEKIDEFLSKRQELVTAYDNYLLGRFTKQVPPHGTNPVPWLYSVLVDQSVESVMGKLGIDNIETRPIFVPLSQIPFIEKTDTPIANDIARRGISLPLHVNMTATDVIRVCDSLVRATRKAA
jgi:perosamine synthetase